MREKAIVVCPGRGTYNATELGYLKQHGAAYQHLLAPIEDIRRQMGQPTVSELDAMESFSPSVHTLGENAAALIYACSVVDFYAINRDKFDIVAIAGNSMGWYTALGLGAALNAQHAFLLANTMGSMMRDKIIGGQIVYPEIDEQWLPDPEKSALLDQQMSVVNAEPNLEVYTSIHFGGYRVIGGNEPGLKKLTSLLPKQDDRFPMRLLHHAAFHTPMMAAVSERAQQQIPNDFFNAPHVPLIDGRGHIWQHYTTEPGQLRDYTLNHQVQKTFNFSKSIEVALKEFAPTKLIVLGPGTTLGGAIAQVMVANGWRGIGSKDDFIEEQNTSPYMLSMGMVHQRELVC